MATANIYLNFNGNCEEAFKFYQTVFGGEFPYVGRYSDMPPAEGGGKTFSEEEANRIMHISLPIGNGTMIMGSDTGGEWAASYTQGNNFSISLTADSRDEADKLFTALAQGGQVTMPLNSTFWGDYFGMLVDKFGVAWMMSYNEKKGQQ
ncbi:MAG: VOC family protein [Bacteroidota bacterium]